MMLRVLYWISIVTITLTGVCDAFTVHGQGNVCCETNLISSTTTTTTTTTVTSQQHDGNKKKINNHNRSQRWSTKSSSSSSSLRMGSDFDFPSAMPEKPQLSPEEKILQSADEFIEAMTNAIGEGVTAPPELEALRQAREGDADYKEIGLKVYELMIERGMLYDEDPVTGSLTPTEFDIKANLDVPEVKNEFAHLYKYGMMMMDRGVLTADEVKETVVERLIKRTGLTPEKFDEWLGY